MGSPTTQAAASWVLSELPNMDWIQLSDAIEFVVRKRLKNASDIEISDYVSSKIGFIEEHIREAENDAFQHGTVFNLEIDSEIPPYVRRTFLPNNNVLDKLKKIDPLEFEHVCARILKALGCESEVTQATNDGGIDFLALGLDILPDGINCPSYCRASIIGQAKRYTDNLIAEKALREFVGASLLAKHDLRVAKRIGPLSPVILAFWTTSDFGPSTKKFASKAGVWMMDGPTISSYLVDLGLKDWIEGLPDEVK